MAFHGARGAYHSDIIGEWKHPEERDFIFHSLAEFPIAMTARSIEFLIRGEPEEMNIRGNDLLIMF